MAPDADVFAYVNPCEAAEQPWWWPNEARAKDRGLWQGDDIWRPPPCPDDPWENSSFLREVRIRRLQVYSDGDVAPPEVCEGIAGHWPWANGVYQQNVEMRRCYGMIQEHERRRGVRYSFILRVKADACSPRAAGTLNNGCRNRYCDVAHLRARGESAIYWKSDIDGFAVVSRDLAGSYFNVSDGFSNCTERSRHGSLMYGEAVLTQHLGHVRSHLKDLCWCHWKPSRTCPRRRWNPLASAPWEWGRWWAVWDWEL